MVKVIERTNRIYWGELRGSSAADDKGATFLYGSTIRFYKRDHVYFENRLMVSGQCIHEWGSSWNFQGYRTLPALPLLKRGEIYLLKASMELEPVESVYLKIIFLDRYEKEIEVKISKSQEMEFQYPKEAYTYRIQLLSAGINEMNFHYLTLTLKDKKDDKVKR